MEKKKPLVVVLSRNYSTGLSVVRSLGAAGYTVDLVASSYKKGNANIVTCSKYVHKWTEVVNKNIKEGGKDVDLLNALLEYAGHSKKPVLFPTDDYTTSVMDKNRSVLEDIFIMPTIVGGGDGCLTEYMSKTYQAELARNAGLLTPQEWIIPLNDEILIPEDMVYPCFVKPKESISGYKKEIAKCSSEEKLVAHLKKLQERYADRSILVQEYLQIDNEIDFSGVCLDQEIIIPAIVKKWNVSKQEKGVTLAGHVLPTQELGNELLEKVVAMLKQFHYMGMFDMELNIVGNKVYFDEVNLRSSNSNFAYFMSGVNLPALYVKEALGEKHTPQEEKVSQYGKSFLNEKVAWEDHIHGYMNKRELEDRIAAADITLLNNKDDPAPGKRFTKHMKARVFKAKLKKIKHSWVKRLKRWKKELRRTLNPVIKLMRNTKYRLMGYPQMKKSNRRNPFAENPRVLVAGRNFCSNLTMARSFGQAGYEVEVLRVFQGRPKLTKISIHIRPDAHSKYVKAYYHIFTTRKRAKRIVNKLIQIADPYRKMLLIPTDDLVTNIADEYMEKLRPYYIMPNVSDMPGEIGRLMSKKVQKELAENAGLPVVNSCVIRTSNHEFEIPETVTYPCFIKPNVSTNGAKSRMRRCDSREELEAILTEYSSNKDVEILVEDFLEIEKEYSILGLSTKHGVVSPGFFVAERGGHDGHRGVALTGRLLPTAQEQQLIDDITRFIATLNFDGLFDVDLIQTPDGKLYFTELNLRYGGSGYAVTCSGVNLPGMFADYMIKGTPIDMNCKIDVTGKHFISELIMLDEYMGGYLSKKEMKTLNKNADIHFIYDPQDPAAYRHFRKFYLPASVMKLLRSMKAKIKKSE